MSEKETDCIFCKIVRGEIPTQKVKESETVLAFLDVNPQAKNHILVIPKKHTTNINELSRMDPLAIKEIFTFIEELTNEDLEDKGFRIVTNLGNSAGQTVKHTHFHLLSDDHLGKFGV